MSAALSDAWLLEGHFDLGRQDPHRTSMISIKENLCEALGLPADGLRIAFFPTGPQFKHTYWWREGSHDYAEAQFVAAIAKEVPVLSLGVSVEKGVESGAPRRPEQVMNRSVWDWPRLIQALPEIVAVDVPALAASLAAPISLRVRTGIDVEGESRRWWSGRAFSFLEDHWCDRHAGRVRVDAEAIVDHVKELDQRLDRWGIVHVVRDFAPKEVDGMTPATAAAILLEFDRIRRRLTSRAPAAERPGR